VAADPGGGVDLGSIEWVEGAVEYPTTYGKPTVLPPLKPVKITRNTDSERSSSDLLAGGEIYATIGVDLPASFGKSPRVKRLFPDFKATEKKYYKEHGILPIIHLAAVRRGLEREGKGKRGLLRRIEGIRSRNAGGV
jgi:4,5-dihydroxyphthalate decarboxylase